MSLRQASRWGVGPTVLEAERPFALQYGPDFVGNAPQTREGLPRPETEDFGSSEATEEVVIPAKDRCPIRLRLDRMDDNVVDPIRGPGSPPFGSAHTGSAPGEGSGPVRAARMSATC